MVQICLSKKFPATFQVHSDNKLMKTEHHFFITICAAGGSGGMEVNMKIVNYCLLFGAIISLNFIHLLFNTDK